MRYYVQIPSYYTSPKNKLEEALRELANQYDRFSFPTSQLPVVKSSLENIINSLGVENKRCKPPCPRWREDGGGANYKNIPAFATKLKDWELATDYAYTLLTLHLCREETDL